MVVPLEDMRELGAARALAAGDARRRRDGLGLRATARSIWPSIYPALLELVRRTARRSSSSTTAGSPSGSRCASTSSRRGRRSRRAHHGSLAREQRRRDRGAPQGGPDSVPRRHLEPRAGDRHGRGRPRRPGREPEVGRARPAADRPRRPRARRRLEGSHLPQVPRRPARVRGRREGDARGGDRGDGDPAQPARRARAAGRRDLRRRGDRGRRSPRARPARLPVLRSPRAQLENVLDMLAGRYPSDEFAELRPRIVWDRTAGVIRGRAGARRLAVTNAGTIPDRGLYGVFQVDGRRPRRRARRGDGLRGAPGADVPARRLDLADRGDHARPRARLARARRPRARCRSGRAKAWGGPTSWARGSARRPASWPRSPTTSATPRCARRTTSTSGRRENLLVFLREQERSTALPTDRTIVVERFRDEIGDWRVCILTPFGGRVHAPWSMALAARLRDALGLEVQSLWSDDGIALHLPDADAPPALADLLVEPDELEELVVQEVGQTALFGARFRENAARALLIPRRRPGQRTPLWQQRLKAQSLLEVARRTAPSRSCSRPTASACRTSSTSRRCAGSCTASQTRELDLVEVETASASPMAASLLFDYVATYMYEDDTPAAERRAQALSLDRELLRELLGQEELRDLLDPGALAEVEASLRPRAAERRRAARPPASGRRAARGRARRRLRRDARPRAPRVPRPLGGERGGGRGRGRRPLSRRVRRHAAGRAAGGVPRARSTTRSTASLLRFARAQRPVHDRARSRRATRSTPSSSSRCSRRSRRATCSCAASSGRAASSASGATPTCCAASAAPRSRCCATRSSPPSRRRSAASCPPGTGSTGARRLREALVPLQGLALPVSLWETEVLPRRVPGYQPAVARPALRGGRGRLDRCRARPRRALLPRGRAAARRPRARRAARTGDGARRRSAPRSAGAPRSGPSCSRRPGSSRPTRCRPCGSSSGPAR